MSKGQKIRLGDIATVVSGSTPSTSKSDYWDGEYNWVTPAEISDSTKVIYSTVRKITAKAIQETSLNNMPVGTVLLSSRAPIGKVAIAGAEMYCNQGFKNLICSNKIYNEYLFWFLKGKKEYLNSLGRGATFKEISKGIVEDITIPLPKLEVQISIASRLNKVSEIISLHKKKLEELDNLIKSIFYDMFGDPAYNIKEWKIDNIESICHRITDGEHATPIRCEKGIHLLSARNILNHELQLDDVDFIDELEYNRIAKRIVPKINDILISCSGSVGRVTRVKDSFKFQMVRSVAILQLKCIVNPIFIEYCFDTPYMQNQINSSINQSSQANLFQGKIKKLKVILPPIDLQNNFAEKVIKIEEQKEIVNRAILESENLFNSLMRQYFD